MHSRLDDSDKCWDAGEEALKAFNLEEAATIGMREPRVTHVLQGLLGTAVPKLMELSGCSKREIAVLMIMNGVACLTAAIVEEKEAQDAASN